MVLPPSVFLSEDEDFLYALLVFLFLFESMWVFLAVCLIIEIFTIPSGCLPLPTLWIIARPIFHSRGAHLILSHLLNVFIRA